MEINPKNISIACTDSKKQADMNERGDHTLVINVPQFCLEGKDIIIFSDLCQVILKTWGSYNNLYTLLKNQGIKTCRFDQTQLRMLKNIGGLGRQVKNCSFIAKEDFTKILHKYDEEYSTDHVNHIQLSTPIMISNITSTTKCQGNQGRKKHCQVLSADVNSSSQSTASSVYNIHAFSIGNQDFVMLSELYNLFETHFKRSDLLNQVLQNLKLVVGTFTANKLAGMEIYTGVTCINSLKSMYITSKDFERVLQYTSALLDTSPPDVTLDQMGKLSTFGARKGNNKEGNVTAGLMSTSSSTAAAIACIPDNNINNVTDEAQADHGLLGSQDSNVAPNSLPILPETCNLVASETASTNTSNSTTSCVIRTCLVKGEVVVCIPDLHKVVIDLYGQSVQVGSYMHRLNIPTHRFSSGALKYLKAHNILSSKATLCTYITKTDAERLLKMYSMSNHSDNQSDSLPSIEWGKPIILENAINKASEDRVESPQLQQSVPAKLKIPLFIINYQVVVTMQDVHRAVELLNGQSMQYSSIRYNLDKLGIVKHKYSYSDVHQLKVLCHINRASSCTYITKADVDMFLQFYTTPENVDRLNLIEWQQPIAVERLENISDSISNPEIEGTGREFEDENNSDTGQVAQEYSISDLYKVFVGDDLESTQSSSNDTDDNQQESVSQVTLSCLSSSPTPLLSFSPSAQCNVATSGSRDEVNSDGDNPQASTTVQVSSAGLSSAGMISIAELVVEPSKAALSHNSASQQPYDRSFEDVNQMQGDIGNPVTSTFCTRNRPTVTSEMGMAVSKQTYTGSQTMYRSPSSCTVVSDSNSGIIECVPSISTGAVTACRVGQMPSAGSPSTSHGKLSTCDLDLVTVLKQ